MENKEIIKRLDEIEKRLSILEKRTTQKSGIKIRTYLIQMSLKMVNLSMRGDLKQMTDK